MFERKPKLIILRVGTIEFVAMEEIQYIEGAGGGRATQTLAGPAGKREIAPAELDEFVNVHVQLNRVGVLEQTCVHAQNLTIGMHIAGYGRRQTYRRECHARQAAYELQSLLQTTRSMSDVVVKELKARDSLETIISEEFQQV